MNSIQGSAFMKIHDGKLNEFKDLCTQIIQAIKTSEPDTTQFDLFFNTDETVCVVREDYRDSSAMLVHLSNVGALLGKILQISDMELEIYGNPSEELRAAIAAANPKIYSFYQGL
jgi:quinol monooxygenase YgiN